MSEKEQELKTAQHAGQETSAPSQRRVLKPSGRSADFPIGAFPPSPLVRCLKVVPGVAATSILCSTLQAELEFGAANEPAASHDKGIPPAACVGEEPLVSSAYR